MASIMKPQEENMDSITQNYKATCPFADCLCKALSTPSLSKANLRLIQFLSKPDEELPQRFPRLLKQEQNDEDRTSLLESYETIIPADLMQKEFLTIIKDLPITPKTEDHHMIAFDQELFYGFDDPYKFDNIGVTKPIFETDTNKPFAQTVKRSSYNAETNEFEDTTAQVVRFLSCGDCDRGPLGIVIQTATLPNGQPKLEFLVCVKSLYFEKVE